MARDGCPIKKFRSVGQCHVRTYWAFLPSAGARRVPRGSRIAMPDIIQNRAPCDPEILGLIRGGKRWNVICHADMAGVRNIAWVAA